MEIIGIIRNKSNNSVAAIDDVSIYTQETYAYAKSVANKAIKIYVTIDCDPNPGTYPLVNQIHIIPGQGFTGLGPTDNEGIGLPCELSYEITEAEYMPF